MICNPTCRIIPAVFTVSSVEKSPKFLNPPNNFIQAPKKSPFHHTLQNSSIFSLTAMSNKAYFISYSSDPHGL
jgi:hypothetical protein